MLARKELGHGPSLIFYESTGEVENVGLHLFYPVFEAHLHPLHLLLNHLAPLHLDFTFRISAASAR